MLQMSHQRLPAGAFVSGPEKLPNLRLLKSLLKCAAVSLIQSLWVRVMMHIAAFTALFFLADAGTTVAGERDNTRVLCPSVWRDT
jgi:hypothetical protein